MRRERERLELEHRDQLLMDQKIASDLEAETLNRARVLQDLEQEDLILARRIAAEYSDPVQHNDIGGETVSGSAVSFIENNFSSRYQSRAPGKGFLVDLTASGSDKSDAEADDLAPLSRPSPLPPSLSYSQSSSQSQSQSQSQTQDPTVLQPRSSHSSSSNSAARSGSGSRSGSVQTSFGLGTKRKQPTKPDATTATRRPPGSLCRFFLRQPATPAASESPASSAASGALSARSPSQSPSQSPFPSRASRSRPEEEAEADTAWQCGRCTFRNSTLLTRCEMCDCVDLT